jgi:hypothetical protein
LPEVCVIPTPRLPCAIASTASSNEPAHIAVEISFLSVALTAVSAAAASCCIPLDNYVSSANVDSIVQNRGRYSNNLLPRSIVFATMWSTSAIKCTNTTVHNSGD